MVKSVRGFRRMGIKKIKPDAGIRHHHGQKLFAYALPTALFADVEMTNTSGARLLAERIAIKAAHAHQPAVKKRPQQFFTRRVKAVFTPLPVLFQPAQHIEIQRDTLRLQGDIPGFIGRDGLN